MNLKLVDKIPQKQKDIVFGFIRRAQSLFSAQSNPYFTISDLPVHLCLLYFNPLDAFKFKHKHENEAIFKISNDGLTMTSNKQFGTILFGDFLKISDFAPMELTFVFKTHSNCKVGFFGFGFATSEFTEYVNDGFNKGKNHSSSIGSNAYFKHCLEFGPSQKHLCFVRHMNHWLDEHSHEHVVAISLDAKTLIGRIWNYEQCKDYRKSTKVCEFFLPQDKKIGIILYTGDHCQTISCVDQQFSSGC